jgi:adenine-specific DNA-methyltransferase
MIVTPTRTLVHVARFGAHEDVRGAVIQGDCLDALTAVVSAQDGSTGARLAYLDPPFNTGERSRGYVDHFDRDDWRAFMEARLLATWGALAPDGSLWVHCDDAEQATLRVTLDDLFGRRAFVGTIVWQRRYSRENRRAFSASHDYLHVYAPLGAEWKHVRNRLPRQDKPGTWSNPDGDPRGCWSTVSLVAQGGHGTSSQFYDVELPSGRVVRPPAGSCWRVTAARFRELVASGEISFGATDNNVPRRKVFLADAKGLVPSTWWTHAEVGHNAEANAESRALFAGGHPFSTPKPERLILRVIEVATNPGDLVLDPFLGSGTTAAVAHKADRRWLGVEALATTVGDFVVPRLQRVVNGSDSGGVSDLLGWAGGGGFDELRMARP